jgi:DNA-binding response OmpR family regulator
MEERRPYAVLLDDDFDAVEMYRLGLELNGFRVSAMTAPEQLFAAVEAEVPDVFVLDWQLPGTNGGEVLEALRRDWRTAAVPVFMLSNFSAEKNGEVDRVFRAGAIAWLTKTNTGPSTLAERLRQALRR